MTNDKPQNTVKTYTLLLQACIHFNSPFTKIGLL